MAKRRSTKFYRANEKQVMQSLGLRQTKNSGSTWLEKGDGQNDHILCELKSTDRESISVKRFDLNKAEYQATVANKIPLFAIQFIDGNETWLLVKPHDLKEIANVLCNGMSQTVIMPRQQGKTLLVDLCEKTLKQPVKKITSSKNAKEKFDNEQKAKYNKTKKAK